MSEKPDPLRELWQQQPVDQPDVAALKRTWSQVRRKQYFYSSMDILGIALFPIILVSTWERFHVFEFIWFTVFAFSGALLSGYVMWLRRFALRHNSNLADYTGLLRLQYQQNIKIAQLTKVACYFFVPLTAPLFIGLWAMEIYETERILRKLTFVSAWFAFCIPIMWIWASRRIARFERKLASLN